MGDVVHVAHQQLQGVLPWLQLHHDFGLPAAEMTVLIVRRYGLIRGWWLIYVNQQMMVTRVGFIDPGGRHTHPTEPELDRYLASGHRSVNR